MVLMNLRRKLFWGTQKFRRGSVKSITLLALFYRKNQIITNQEYNDTLIYIYNGVKEIIYTDVLPEDGLELIIR